MKAFFSVPMDTAKLAYWSAFSVPAIFIVARTMLQRAIDGPPWERKHFYIGVDLSIFSLAALAGNLIDELRMHEEGFTGRCLFTLLLVFIYLLALFYQVTVHQQYERPGASSPGKTWMLCGLSNAIGAALVGVFVWLKVRGSL